MSSLVVMVEEQSAKELLDIILPKLVPSGTALYVLKHSGKSDLRKSVPNKLRGWNTPDTKFVVLQDQDSADCYSLKQEWQTMCNNIREGVLVRIVCTELESWYFGDLLALERAYVQKISYIIKKRKYRDPDKIKNPKKELQKLLPKYQPIDGAKKIGLHMDVDGNTSTSFNMFVSGIRKMFFEHRNL